VNTEYLRIVLKSIIVYLSYCWLTNSIKAL